MRETLVKTEEFKASPLGKIPKDWDIFPLSKIVKKIKRGPSLAINNDGVGVRYLTSDNISESGEIDWAVCKHLNIKPELLDSLLSPGDVIVNCVNSAAQIGKVSFIDSLPETTTVGFNNFALSLDKNLVVPRFTFYLFSHSLFQRQISATVKPAINQASFSSQDIIALSVPLPSIYEQQRIADILNTVDQAIAHTSSLIAKLKQMKAGLLHDLLTRGLDENEELRDAIAHPEQFKDSPLGRIPKGWKVQPLSELANVDRGKFTHRPRNDPRFYGGSYPFIQTGDIAKAGGGKLSVYSQTLNAHGITVSREFPIGTIAITIAANIADTAILSIPVFFPDSIVGAIVKEPNSICYVELCIRCAKQQLDARAPQSAQKNINLEDLRPLLIAVPEPTEQYRIAEVYEAHDTRIRTEEAYRDKLKLQKQGLMQDLLTGRVRVEVKNFK